MDARDKKLLENLFDSLDRLFDGDSKVIDIWQLVFATETALKGSFKELALNTHTHQFLCRLPADYARIPSLCRAC